MNRNYRVEMRSFLDGTNRSALARAFRLCTLPFSIPYSLIVRGRNAAYDRGIIKSQKATRPIVSVGNLTMGGVGKTPFVAWLTNAVIQSGKQAALVSRGYKAQAQKRTLESQNAYLGSLKWLSKALALEPDARQFFYFNDEACELALRFPDTPHFVCANRFEAVQAITRLFPEIDAILLDDAFQHRRMARNLDIVLLDALSPFGGEHLAPSGYLREPLEGLKRANVVILNRADLISKDARDTIRNRVVGYAPHALWCEISQRPRFVMQRISTPLGKELRREEFTKWQGALQSRNVLAFCGLGAPQGFQKTLLAERFNLVSFMAFSDHCVYTHDDFLTIDRTASRFGADVVLTTMKDFVKLDGQEPIEQPVLALGIDVEFLSGEAEFKRMLTAVLDEPKSGK